MHENLANFDNICRFVRLFPFHRADYYVRKSFTLRWFDFAEFSVLQAKSSKSLLLSAFAFILTSFSFALYFSFFITLILSEFNLPILSFGLLLTSIVPYNSYLVNQSLCMLSSLRDQYIFFCFVMYLFHMGQVFIDSVLFF